jgi:hypothetical protein
MRRMPAAFDPALAQSRVARFWDLESQFGVERGALKVYLHEIVSDRYQLISGLQVLRDELQFADRKTLSDVLACGADFEAPSVVTTLAHTSCGDRVGQEAKHQYEETVASRFATMSEVGGLKVESFSPAGGGTDDGATLAHVTIAHQLDESLRARIYAANPQSFVLVAIDLTTHVGQSGEATTRYGTTREAPWREPRAACGAVMGALEAFNEDNAVHRRLRRDLGEENYAFLRERGVRSAEGIDITPVVAASIICVQGLINTARACAEEIDERGVAHLTASVVVNRTSAPDPLIYLSRATVFGGEFRMQGLGTNARLYEGKMVDESRSQGLLLTYGGQASADPPSMAARYSVRTEGAQSSPYD